MESVINILNKPLFELGDTAVNVGQLLLLPLAALLVLLFAAWFISSVSKRLLNSGRDQNLVLLIRRALWLFVILALFFSSLSLLGVPLGAFAFLSGAVAIGIGFGAQNVINNFISGWILMGERPIRVGDLLEINGTLGRVESINTRSTRIKRVDGVRIVVPNSLLLENMVVNWNLGDEDIRIFVSVGVAYGSPVRTVAQLIAKAVNEQEDVLPEPEPVVLFQDFGDSALVFETYFWTRLHPGGNLRRLRSDVRFRIDELFRENGITIAFPQRDVHLDGSLQLVDHRALEPEK